jgi:hypothetical protein
MKASEALILGSLVTQQGFGAESPASSRPCALGTIGMALGLKFDNLTIYSKLEKVFPWMRESGCEVPCPKCDLKETRTMSVIYHLNDYHKMPRNEIAKWIASVEPKELEYKEPVSLQTDIVAV